jgi:streptogramin lyase
LAIPGQPGASALDVFPGVRDEIWGMALDASGGLYVASYGNGLAYLTAGSYAPTYWSQTSGLPDNFLTGVAVDQQGDVWVATQSAGVARYAPAAKAWTYYTTVSGLPANGIRQVYVDKYQASGRTVYFATNNGIAVYAGP